MTWVEILLLVSSGLLVGFINTLAGGGTVISLSLLMFMGLPADIANGTNRVAVVFQTITSVSSFRRQHVLKLRKGVLLGLPVILGSLIGALIAIDVDKIIIEKSYGGVLFLMLLLVVFNPRDFLKGRIKVMEKPLHAGHYILFFFLGLYGGFIHVGIGYFLLAAIVGSAGYDLIHANAIKVLIVLLYVPFTLLIFVYHGMVNWEYGLVHSIGNIAGAWLGARYAVSWGNNAVRVIMIIVIIFSILHVFNIIKII